MPEDKILEIYDYIKSQRPNIIEYDSFKQGLTNEMNLQDTYNYIKSLRPNIVNYADFKAGIYPEIQAFANRPVSKIDQAKAYINEAIVQKRAAENYEQQRQQQVEQLKLDNPLLYKNIEKMHKEGQSAELINRFIEEKNKSKEKGNGKSNMQGTLGMGSRGMGQLGQISKEATGEIVDNEGIREFIQKPLTTLPLKMVEAILPKAVTDEEIDEIFDFSPIYPLKILPIEARREIYKVARGLATGTAKLASGLTSPLNLGLLVSGGAIAQKVPAASRIISAMFTGSMASAIPEEYKVFMEAVNSGDSEAIADAGMQMLGTLFFTIGAGKHAIKGRGGVVKPEIKPDVRKGIANEVMTELNELAEKKNVEIPTDKIVETTQKIEDTGNTLLKYFVRDYIKGETPSAKELGELSETQRAIYNDFTKEYEGVINIINKEPSEGIITKPKQKLIELPELTEQQRLQKIADATKELPSVEKVAKVEKPTEIPPPITEKPAVEVKVTEPTKIPVGEPKPKLQDKFNEQELDDLNVVFEDIRQGEAGYRQATQNRETGEWTYTGLGATFMPYLKAVEKKDILRLRDKIKEGKPLTKNQYDKLKDLIDKSNEFYKRMEAEAKWEEKGKFEPLPIEKGEGELLRVNELEKGEKFTINKEEFEVAKRTDKGVVLVDDNIIKLADYDQIEIDKGSFVKAGEPTGKPIVELKEKRIEFKNKNLEQLKKESKQLEEINRTNIEYYNKKDPLRQQLRNFEGLTDAEVNRFARINAEISRREQFIKGDPKKRVEIKRELRKIGIKFDTDESLESLKNKLRKAPESELSMFPESERPTKATAMFDTKDVVTGDVIKAGETTWKYPKLGEVSEETHRKLMQKIQKTGELFTAEEIKAGVPKKEIEGQEGLFEGKAESNIKTALKESAKTINALFGGEKIGIKGGIDEVTYKQAKVHFDKAWEAYKAAGKDIKTFIEDFAKEVGEHIKPYLNKYKDEYRADVVNRFTDIIRKTKPIRGHIETLRSKERSKRAAEMTSIAKKSIEEGKPEEAYFKAKGALKGELPAKPVELIRKRTLNKITEDLKEFTEGDVKDLFNIILDKIPKEKPYTRVTAYDALMNLLQGKVPRPFEIKLLEEIYGKDFTKTMRKQIPLWRRIGMNIFEVGSFSKALKASFDISASFRQAGLIVFSGRPKLLKTWGKGFGQQIKALISEENYGKYQKDLKNREYSKLGEDSGLELTGIGGKTKILKREEVYISKFADKIWGIKHSARAYVTLLNKIRADYFDSLANILIKDGKTFKTHPEEFKAIAGYINTFTGRGSLNSLKNYLPALNSALFSPRLLAARFQTPFYIFSKSPLVRAEAAKTLLGFAAVVGGMLYLADQSDMASVEWNPESSDFLKIKIGNTRIDLLGGFQQIMRFVGNVVTGRKKSTISGRTYDIKLDETIGKFLQYKASPMTGFFIDLIRNETPLGEEFTILPKDFSINGITQSQLFNRFTPLIIEDILDAYDVEGINMALKVTPLVITGVGVQTHRLSDVSNLFLYKSQIAWLKYGKGWDDISYAQQKLIKITHPEIAEKEKVIKATRGEMPQIDRTLENAMKVGKEIQNKLDPDIKEKLNGINYKMSGVQRTIADAFYLNDTRFQHLKDETVKNLNKLLKVLLDSKEYKDATFNDKIKKIDDVVVFIKDLSRLETLAKYMSPEIEKELKQKENQ